MLLERSNQAISATEIQRHAREIFDKLEKGKQSKYVVMRNNIPVLVMLSVDAYEALVDELEDLRLQAVAEKRLTRFDPKRAVSHAEMLKRFPGI